MSLFRLPSSASAGMNPYNEGDNVLFMVTEEHRKPNIIRSSGAKLTKAHHPFSESDSHAAQEEETIKTESSTADIVFTTTDASNTDTMLSTFAENIQDFEGDQFPNSLQHVVVSTEDLNTFQHQDLDIDLKVELQESPESESEEELVEAAIQTPEGNFMVLMRGNEIISARPMNPSDQSAETEQIPAATSNDSSMQVRLGATNEETVSGFQPQECQEGGGSYILCQLPNGETIMIQGGFEEGQQIVMNENQEIVQLLPAVQSQSMAPNSSKASKPRKRCNTEQQAKVSSSPKKTYTNNAKKAKKSYPAAKPLLSRLVNPENSMSLYNNPQRQQCSASSLENSSTCVNDESRIVEQKPIIELKPKPFRFDIPESEADGFENNNFLSLVIENFQNHQSEQEDRKPNISDIPHPVAEIKIDRENVVLIAPTELCPKCSFKAVDRKSLAQHVSRFHNEDLPHTCTQCDKKFTYDFQLTNHYKIHHGISNEQTLSCNVCGKKFPIESALSFHKRSCNPGSKKEGKSETEVANENVIDDEGGATISSKSSNRRKQTVYSRDKEFPCEEPACYKWFSDKFALLRHHTNVHLAKAPFPCNICEKTFDSKEALLSHLASHEDGIARPHECQICKKCFKLESHLVGHMRAHIQRDTSDNVKSREQELLKHPEKLMQSVKISYRNKTASEGFSREVFCHICDDIFPNKLALNQHKLCKHPSIHGDISMDSQEDEKNSNQSAMENEQNGCTTVVASGKTFHSITDWRRHADADSDCSKPHPLVTLLTSGRPFRDVADVQNDFKNLSTKILEKSKDNFDEIKAPDDSKRPLSKVGADLVKDIPKLVGPPKEIPAQSDLEQLSKKSKVPARSKNSDPDKKIIPASANISLDNVVVSKTGPIPSTLNQMSSRMITRAGVKPLNADFPTRDKDLPVKKRKQVMVDIPLEGVAAELSTSSRELRSRVMVSSTSQDAAKSPETKRQKPNNPIKENVVDLKSDHELILPIIMDKKNVEKSFVRIFQKVKKQQDNQPNQDEGSSKPRARKK